MALIFMDGFDKFGGVNTSGTSVAALLAAGDWTSATSSAGSPNIVAPLSATGQALAWTIQTQNVAKTLPASYGRLIGGFRFNAVLGAATSTGFITFTDAGSNQASVTINGVTGTISVRNGQYNGTALGTSAASVISNSTHYLEFDITFGNAAAYQVWLDGVSILSGSGDTTTTANNTANGIAFGVGTGASTSFTVDDFYLFDTTGSTNNAVLLTSPRIETTFPVSDSAVQFAVGAGILGSSVARSSTTTGLAANFLQMRRFVTSVAGTLNSIGGMPTATNGTVNLRGVVYADSSGVVGSLMSSGTTVTGTTANTAITLPLTTPQSLAAGTAYWLGVMSDATVSGWANLDGALSGYRVSATFASGAPATPVLSSGFATWMFWGNLTGITGNNYDEVNNQPPDGQYSYIYDSTVGHEDLYNFNALSSPPGNIYAVGVKAYAQKSDSGTRTVSMRVKSGATDSGGSATGQALGTSFGWLASYFTTDPDTSLAWSSSTLNAATSGFRVDS